MGQVAENEFVAEVAPDSREELVGDVGEAAVAAWERVSGEPFHSGEVDVPTAGAEPPTVDEQAPRPEPVTAAPPVSAEESADSDPKPTGSDVIQAAMVAARRTNIPNATLDAWLEKDPDAFLAWAEKRGQAQQQIDKDYEELQRLRSQAAQPPEVVAPTPAEGGDRQPGADDKPSAQNQPSPDPTPQGDQRDPVKMAVEMLGLPESDARELVAALQPQLAPDRTPEIQALQSTVQATQSQAQALADTVRQQQVEKARVQLQPEFPGLEDQKRFAAVESRAAKLIVSGQYTTAQVDDAFRDACRVEFWEDREDALASKGKPKPDSTQQPSTPGGGLPDLKGERTPGELSFHFLQQGMSPDQAARAVARTLSQ